MDTRSLYTTRQTTWDTSTSSIQTNFTGKATLTIAADSVRFSEEV